MDARGWSVLKGFQRDWNRWGGRIRNYFRRILIKLRRQMISWKRLGFWDIFFGNKIFVTAEDVDLHSRSFLMSLIQSEPRKCFISREISSARFCARSGMDGRDDLYEKCGESETKAGWNSGFRAPRAPSPFVANYETSKHIVLDFQLLSPLCVHSSSWQPELCYPAHVYCAFLRHWGQLQSSSDIFSSERASRQKFNFFPFCANLSFLFWQ